MMLNIKCLQYTAMLILAMGPSWAFAHHGVGAIFDLSKSIELQGEVKQLIWRNPHVRITLGVTTDDGNEQLWVVEAQSVSMLRQRDITEKLFEVGDNIKLAGNPARGGVTEIYATNVLLPDGREMAFAQAAEPRWQDEVLGKTGPRFAATGDSSQPELGLFRVWSYAPGQRPILQYFDFDKHPLADSARAAGESYNRLTDNAAMGECAVTGMPRIIGNPYPRDFIDQGDTIVMRLEEYDTVRSIRLTPADSGAPESSPLGYSVGYWDEGTLVVTTTNISNGVFSLGIPLSEDLKIVEYYTPSTDGSRLDYRMTVTDPAVFFEPVELETFWIYLPGVTVEPYECLDG